MLKIDIHTHILPVSLEHHRCGAARMMVDGKFFREIESNCWDPAARMHECDAHRVDVQVLTTPAM